MDRETQAEMVEKYGLDADLRHETLANYTTNEAADFERARMEAAEVEEYRELERLENDDERYTS